MRAGGYLPETWSTRGSFPAPLRSTSELQERYRGHFLPYIERRFRQSG